MPEYVPTADDFAEHYGLRRAQSGRHVCLHRLTQGRCGKRDCLGMGHRAYADHLSLWLLDGAPAVIVSQPYSLSDDALDHLHADRERFGLHTTITTSSWYAPGATLLVELWTRDGFRRAAL